MRRLERDDAERRAALRTYHDEVVRRTSALPWIHMGAQRTLLSRMQMAMAGIEASELQNIQRWIAVRPGQETLCAPGDRVRARHGGADAEIHWNDAIVPWRELRKENGQQSYNRVFGFLADPDSAAVHLGIGAEAHDALMAETYGRMRRVVEVRFAPAAVPDEEAEVAPRTRCKEGSLGAVPRRMDSAYPCLNVRDRGFA
jgi:hypothetical protein